MTHEPRFGPGEYRGSSAEQVVAALNAAQRIFIDLVAPPVGRFLADLDCRLSNCPCVGRDHAEACP